MMTEFTYPFNTWAILNTQNKSALIGCNTKFINFFFIGASATKSLEKL